jgi:hypothetical protein
MPFQCSIPGCTSLIAARGWCYKHYQRWRFHGDPLYVPSTQTPLEKLHERTNFSDTCWLWDGPVSKKTGYGKVSFGRGNSISPHVLAWTLMNCAPPPEGKVVAHTCDVRNCWRNDEQGIYVVGGEELLRWGHLFLCTYKQNTLDMIEKGRRVKTFGEDARRSHLSNRDVEEIRRLYKTGKHTQTSLAKQFNISQPTAHEIVREKTWRHLTKECYVDMIEKRDD